MATNPPQNPVFPRKENPASLPIRFQGLAHGRADARKSAEIYPLKTEGGGGMYWLAGWRRARGFGSGSIGAVSGVPGTVGVCHVMSCQPRGGKDFWGRESVPECFQFGVIALLRFLFESRGDGTNSEICSRQAGVQKRG